MNLTIILFTVGIIGGFLFGLLGDGDFCLGLLGSVAGFLFAALISVFVCGLAIPMAAETAGAAQSIEKVEVTPLYALKDNSNLSGTFFLGSGSVNETDYYYYIVKEEGKGYCVKKKAINNYTYLDYLNAEDCKYDEPCLAYYYNQWDNKILRFFAWSPENWYTFYVPEGSIIENYYEVDLEG
jgi:hypothetical protein